MDIVERLEWLITADENQRISLAELVDIAEDARNAIIDLRGDLTEIAALPYCDAHMAPSMANKAIRQP